MRFKKWKLPSFGKEWDREIAVESSVHKGKFYTFNLHKRLCDCRTKPEWNPMCRHQAKYIVENSSAFGLSPLELGLFIDFYGTKHYLRGLLKNGVECILGFNESPEWVNVYLPDSNRYAYSLCEDRWSYGREPEHASKIIKAIDKYVESFVDVPDDDSEDHDSKIVNDSTSPTDGYTVVRRGKNGGRWFADEATLKSWVASGNINPMDEIHNHSSGSSEFAKGMFPELRKTATITKSQPGPKKPKTIAKLALMFFTIVLAVLVFFIILGALLS